MIWHDFHRDNVILSFTADFAEDGFQAIIDSINQNPPTVRRAPHDMILAGIHYIAVRFESPSVLRPQLWQKNSSPRIREILPQGDKNFSTKNDRLHA